MRNCLTRRVINKIASPDGSAPFLGHLVNTQSSQAPDSLGDRYNGSASALGCKVLPLILNRGVAGHE